MTQMQQQKPGHTAEQKASTDPHNLQTESNRPASVDRKALLGNSSQSSPAIRNTHEVDLEKGTITIKKGDNLSFIAQEFLQDKNKASLLYDLNKDVIGPNKDNIKVGQQLKLPPEVIAELQKSAEVRNVATENGDLLQSLMKQKDLGIGSYVEGRVKELFREKGFSSAEQMAAAREIKEQGARAGQPEPQAKPSKAPERPGSEVKVAQKAAPEKEPERTPEEKKMIPPPDVAKPAEIKETLVAESTRETLRDFLRQNPMQKELLQRLAQTYGRELSDPRKAPGVEQQIKSTLTGGVGMMDEKLADAAFADLKDRFTRELSPEKKRIMEHITAGVQNDPMAVAALQIEPNSRAATAPGMMNHIMGVEGGILYALEEKGFSPDEQTKALEDIRKSVSRTNPLSAEQIEKNLIDYGTGASREAQPPPTSGVAPNPTQTQNLTQNLVDRDPAGLNVAQGLSPEKQLQLQQMFQAAIANNPNLPALFQNPSTSSIAEARVKQGLAAQGFNSTEQDQALLEIQKMLKRT